jgi:hypothetical protein
MIIILFFKGIRWNSPIIIPLPPSWDKLCANFCHARFILKLDYWLITSYQMYKK